jgi:hypothetical protein
MAKNNAFDDEELEALLKEASTTIEVKKKEDFKEVAKKVMETHKDTLAKLSDTTTKWQQAFGVNKNEHGKWDVTEVLYNSLTNECRINSVVRSESSKAVAQARCQEAVARVLNGLPLSGMNKPKR